MGEGDEEVEFPPETSEQQAVVESLAREERGGRHREADAFRWKPRGEDL
jgi:hypothetical protein